jgi:GWxTD domain-containing protein
MRTRFVFAVLAAVGLSAMAFAQIARLMPDKEWKNWLDEVRPLMLPAEIARVRQAAPSERADFREAFWRARSPDPASAGNAVRSELEQRIRTAPRGYRYHGTGPWNDCGRVWLLLGAPERVGSVAGTRVPPRFYDGAVSDISAGPTVLWTYRHHPRLPKLQEEFTFAFNSRCEWASTRPADRLLEQAAASYVSDVR